MAGAAAFAGEEEKDAHHQADVEAAGGCFYPLIIETFGFWTPASLARLTIIASKTMTKTRFSCSQAFNSLLEQLFGRLRQFNARTINDRLDLAVDVEQWDLPTV